MGPSIGFLEILQAGSALFGARSSIRQARSAKETARAGQIESDRQQKIQAKADIKVAERTAIEETKATERRTRLARGGRRGLLFGSAAGVEDTDVLGG